MPKYDLAEADCDLWRFAGLFDNLCIQETISVSTNLDGSIQFHIHP
jgi:hypothetical protein